MMEPYREKIKELIATDSDSEIPCGLPEDQIIAFEEMFNVAEKAIVIKVKCLDYDVWKHTGIIRALAGASVRGVRISFSADMEDGDTSEVLSFYRHFFKREIEDNHGNVDDESIITVRDGGKVVHWKRPDCRRKAAVLCFNGKDTEFEAAQ